MIVENVSGNLFLSSTEEMQIQWQNHFSSFQHSKSHFIKISNFCTSVCYGKKVSAFSPDFTDSLYTRLKILDRAIFLGLCLVLCAISLAFIGKATSLPDWYHQWSVSKQNNVPEILSQPWTLHYLPSRSSYYAKGGGKTFWAKITFNYWEIY